MQGRPAPGCPRRPGREGVWRPGRYSARRPLCVQVLGSPLLSSRRLRTCASRAAAVPSHQPDPGALSRGLGSSHRCRLASGPALCRQAPVLRRPTQAPSASEVAPLRATRKVWCISRWAFKHGAAAGPRVPPVALPSRTLRKRPGLSYCRGTGPERLSISSTETFLPGGISVWRRARALPRDPGLDLVDGTWWFSREPLGRTSLLSFRTPPAP